MATMSEDEIKGLTGLVERLTARARNARAWSADTAPEYPKQRAAHRREAEDLEQAASALSRLLSEREGRGSASSTESGRGTIASPTAAQHSDGDDGQPDEFQEWQDYDPDC